MEKRDFKGIWIPKEIYLSTELNWTDKILLIEIDSLDNEEHCFANNDYFAKFLGVSTVSISNSISKLKKLGYIEQVSFNGRERILKSNLMADLKKTLRQTQSELYICNKENFKYNNIDNNINNKINKYMSSFNEFWKEYPKQRAGSKDKAYKSYCRVIDEKRATEQKLLESVKLYAQSEEVKKGFAKGCAAWLNDDRFNNEYNSVKSEKMVQIDIGKFFLNPYSIEYEQEVKGMTEKQCDDLWKWFIDNFEGQMVSDEYVRKVIRKANHNLGS